MTQRYVVLVMWALLATCPSKAEDCPVGFTTGGLEVSSACTAMNNPCPCPSSLELSGTYTLTDGSGSNNYGNSARCAWRFADLRIPVPDNGICFEMTNIDTEDNYDYVAVCRCATTDCTEACTDKPDAYRYYMGNDPSIAFSTTYPYTYTAEPICTSASYPGLRITFYSDNSVNAGGFEATLTFPLAQDCQICDKGYSTDACTACAAGSYKDVVGSAACVLCPASTYSSTTAATTEDVCVSCPSGSISVSGSDSITDCTCTSEFTGPAGGPCICPANYEKVPGYRYDINHTQSLCTTRVRWDGLNAEQCEQWCDRDTNCIGYAFSANYFYCEICSGDATVTYHQHYTTYFKAQEPQCRECAQGFASTAGQPCACQAGYEISSKSEYFGPIEDRFCSSLNDRIADTYPADCEAHCDSLVEQATEGRWWETSCAGYALKASDEEDPLIRQCHICSHGGGEWAQFSGFSLYLKFSEEVCGGCELGKYSSDGLVCQQCPGNSTNVVTLSTTIDDCICSAGFAGQAGACVQCATGKYKMSPGDALCTDCPAGFQSDASFTACVACVAGTYELFDICTDCPPHSTSESQATTCLCNEGYTGLPEACTQCALGTYKNTLGSEACTPCAPGSEANDAFTNCTACTSNTYEADEVCTNCPADSTAAPDATSCQCNQGYKQMTYTELNHVESTFDKGVDNPLACYEAILEQGYNAIVATLRPSSGDPKVNYNDHSCSWTFLDHTETEAKICVRMSEFMLLTSNFVEIRSCASTGVCDTSHAVMRFGENYDGEGFHEPICTTLEKPRLNVYFFSGIGEHSDLNEYFHMSITVDSACAVCNNTVCELCPAGTYKTEIGSSACIDCQDGFVSDDSRVLCNACEVGKAEIDGTCTPCVNNTYTNTNASTECQSCNPGYSANSDHTGCGDPVACPENSARTHPESVVLTLPTISYWDTSISGTYVLSEIYETRPVYVKEVDIEVDFPYVLYYCAYAQRWTISKFYGHERLSEIVSEQWCMDIRVWTFNTSNHASTIQELIDSAALWDDYNFASPPEFKGYEISFTVNTYNPSRSGLCVCNEGYVGGVGTNCAPAPVCSENEYVYEENYVYSCQPCPPASYSEANNEITCTFDDPNNVCPCPTVAASGVFVEGKLAGTNQYNCHFYFRVRPDTQLTLDISHSFSSYERLIVSRCRDVECTDTEVVYSQIQSSSTVISNSAEFPHLWVRYLHSINGRDYSGSTYDAYHIAWTFDPYTLTDKSFCICNSGYAGHFTACQACTPGKYAIDGPIDRVCQNCAYASFSTVAAVECTQCPLGTYWTTLDNMYLNESARLAQCEQNATLMCATDIGLPYCQYCPANTKQAQSPASFYTDPPCAACPDDTLSNIGSYRCTGHCDAGYFANENDFLYPCQQCEEGKYKAERDSDACTLCRNSWRSDTNTNAASVTCSSTNCECSDCVSCQNGEITDGSDHYTNNANCQWLITPATPETIISFQFTFFETESSYDFVTVNRCTSETCYTKEQLFRNSGNVLDTRTFETSTSYPYLQIILTSDGSVQKPGFIGTWSVNEGEAFTCPECGLCTTCPDDLVAPKTGMTSCITCDSRGSLEGFTGSYEQTVKDPNSGECVCMAGYSTFNLHGLGSYWCEEQPCQADQYKPDIGNHPCTHCNQDLWWLLDSDDLSHTYDKSNTTQFIQAATSVYQCLCAPGREPAVVTDDETTAQHVACTKCPLGWFQPEDSWYSHPGLCQQCPFAMTTFPEDWSFLEDIKNSELRLYSTSGQNFPSPGTGLLYSIEGASSNASCSYCPSNYYAAGRSHIDSLPDDRHTSQTFHEPLPLEEATRELGVMCVICPDNSCCTPLGSHDVKDCQCIPGYYNTVSNAAPVCEPCPAGTFKNESGNHACTLCPAGTYQPLWGMVSAEACIQSPANTFSTRGSTEVQHCPQYMTALPGSTSVDDCVCGPGFFYDPTGVCYPCVQGGASGWKNESSNSACTPCPLGYGYGTLTCKHHIYGLDEYDYYDTCTTFVSWHDAHLLVDDHPDYLSTPNSYVADSKDTCEPCPVNHYGKTVTLSAGSYLFGVKLTNTVVLADVNCLQCPDGQTTNGMTAQTLASCKCPNGTVPSDNPLLVKTNSDFWVEATYPVGAACDLCREGSFLAPGETSCTECPAGYTSRREYRLQSATECYQCPVGKYREWVTLRYCFPPCEDYRSYYACIQCPIGSTSPAGSEGLASCVCQMDQSTPQYNIYLSIAGPNFTTADGRRLAFSYDYPVDGPGEPQALDSVTTDACPTCTSLTCPDGQYRVGCSDANFTPGVCTACDAYAQCHNAEAHFGMSTNDGITNATVFRDAENAVLTSLAREFWDDNYFLYGCHGLYAGNCYTCQYRYMWTAKWVRFNGSWAAGMTYIPGYTDEQGLHPDFTNQNWCPDVPLDVEEQQKTYYMAGCGGLDGGQCTECAACPPGQFRAGCNNGSPGECLSCAERAAICDRISCNNTHKTYYEAWNSTSNSIYFYSMSPETCRETNRMTYLSNCGSFNHVPVHWTLDTPQRIALKQYASDVENVHYQKTYLGNSIVTYGGVCQQCADCPTGQFRDGCDDLSAGVCSDCVSCSQNFYRIRCRGAYAGECYGCEPCGEGNCRQNCGGDTPDSNGTCISCEQKALQCAEGEYLAGCGQRVKNGVTFDTHIECGSCTPCRTCNNGFVTSQCGGQVAGTCSCPPGNSIVYGASPSDDVCVPCAANYYQSETLVWGIMPHSIIVPEFESTSRSQEFINEANMYAQCTPCYFNRVSPPGATSSDQCVCPTGFVSVRDVVWNVTNIETINGTRIATPAQLYLSLLCVCPAGFQIKQDESSPLRCMWARQSVLTTLPNGTSVANPNAGQVMYNYCAYYGRPEGDFGFVDSNGILKNYHSFVSLEESQQYAWSMATCVACVHGTYSTADKFVDGRQDRCFSCLTRAYQCRPDVFITVEGVLHTSSANKGLKWLDGCNATHAGVCRDCETCPEGLFRIDCDLQNPGFCGTCPDGYWYNEYYRHCQHCDANPCMWGAKRFNCGGNFMGGCACPPGTYNVGSLDVRVSYQDACVPCPAGTYNALWDQTQCLSCQTVVSLSSSAPGSVSSEDCVCQLPMAIDVVWQEVAGEDRCACGRGRYMVETSSGFACADAESGTYQPFFHAAEALPCPTDCDSPPLSTSIDDCVCRNGRRRLFGFVQTYNSTSTRRLLEIPGFDAPADVLERYHRVSVVDRAFVCACPLGTYSSGCLPCPACEPGFYRSGCGIQGNMTVITADELSEQLASNGSCVPCEACEQSDDAGPFMRVGCLHHAGHNDAAGECKSRSLLVRTPWCPADRGVPPVSLGGYTYSDVFQAEYDTVNFLCSRPCDGRSDVDLGRCDGPFACNTLTCMSEAADRSIFPTPPVFACPVRMTNAEHVSSTAAAPTDVRTLKRQQRCVACSDCAHINTQDAAHFDHWGAGCARECSSLLCPGDKIWDWTARACRFCEELSDARLCSNEDLDRNALTGRDVTGNLPLIRFSQCLPARWGMQAAYGSCRLCEMLTCAADEYQATCLPQLVPGAYDPGSTRVSALAISPCRFCDLRREPAAAIFRQQYLSIDGSAATLSCQLSACRPRDGVAMTGMRNYGPVCTHACQTFSCPSGSVFVPCALPLQAYCRPLFRADTADRTAHAALLDEANFLAEPLSFRGADGAVRRHGFASFENTLVNTLSDSAHDQHQCVWNAAGITDSQHLPGGISQVFWPPAYAYAETFEARGTKFCRQWSRADGVTYPLLPLQNTVALSCLDTTDCSISAEARRIFVDTPARAASYAFTGESLIPGDSSGLVFSSDATIEPPAPAPAADVGGAGQLYLLLDASNAPHVSVAVHVPDDRGLEQAPWLRAFLFTFLAADATLPNPNASPAPLSATASVHADETFGASNCLSVDHVDPRFLAPRSFDTLFQARLAPHVYEHVQEWRARGTEAVDHTLDILSDAYGSSTPMRVVRRDASAARIVVQVAPAPVLDLNEAMSGSHGVFPGLYAHHHSMANWKLNSGPSDLLFTFHAAVLPAAFQLRQAAWPAVEQYWNTPHKLLCPVLLASASQLLCAHMQGVEDVTPAIDERQILGPVAKIGTRQDTGLLALVRPLTATGTDMRTATLMARWDIRRSSFAARDGTWRRVGAVFASRVLAMAAFPGELWALEYAAPALHIAVHPVAFPTDYTVQPSFVPTFGAQRASAVVELPVDVLPDPASTGWLHHCRIEVRQYNWPPLQAVVACAFPDAATNQLLLAVVAYSFASNTSEATLVAHTRAHVALPGAAAEYTPAFLSLYAINDNFWALAAHGLIFQFDTRAHGELRRVPSVLDGMHIVKVGYTVLFTLTESTINVTTFLRDCVELPSAPLDVVTAHGFSVFSVGDGADVVYSRQGFPLDRKGDPLVLPSDTFADPRFWRDLLFAADSRHVSMPLAIVQPDGTNTSLRDAALQIDLQPTRLNSTSELPSLPVLLKLRMPPTTSVHFIERLANGSSVPRLTVSNSADVDDFRIMVLQGAAADIYEPDPLAPRVHLPAVHAMHLFGAEIVACNFLHFVPSAHEVHGALAILQSPTATVSVFTRAHTLSAAWRRVRRLYPGAIASHSRLSVDFHRVGTPEQLRQHATIALDDLQLLPVLSHVPCARHDNSLRTVLYVPSAADLIVLGMPTALETPTDWARLHATAALDLTVALDTTCRFRVALFHVDSDGLPLHDLEDDNLRRMGCNLQPAGTHDECSLEIPLSAPHTEMRWVGAELSWESASCVVNDLHAFFFYLHPFQLLLRCPPAHFFDATTAACAPCNTLQTAIHCPIGQRLPGCPALQHDTACVPCTDGSAEVFANRAEYLPPATSNVSCAWACRPGFFRDGETCAPCTTTLRCAAGFYREPCTTELPERCVACTPLEETHGEFARYERFVANCSTECVASAYRSVRGSCHRCWTREELLVSALQTSLPDTIEAATSRFYRFRSCSTNANAAVHLCVPRNGSRITAHAPDFDVDCPRECDEGWHDTVAGCQQCPPVLDPSGHALSHAQAFDYLQDCAVRCRAPFVNASARGASGDCVLCNATCPVGTYLTGAACDECRNCSSSQSDPRFHFTSTGTLDDPHSCIEHCLPGFYNRFALGVCHAHATPTCLPGFFLRPGTHAQDAACVPCGVCPGQRVDRPCNTSANTVCASCGVPPPRARFGDEPAPCTLICDDAFILNRRLALCEPCPAGCPVGTYAPAADVRANCSDCHPCTPKPAASVWVENIAGDRTRAACAWRCRTGHTLQNGACVATAPSYPPELSSNYVLRCSPGYTLDSAFQCVSCLSDKLDIQTPSIANLGSTWTWRAIGAPCAWYCLPGLHPYRRGPGVIHCLSYAQRRYAAVDGAASADTQLVPVAPLPELLPTPESTPAAAPAAAPATAEEELERSMLTGALATALGVVLVVLSLLCCLALARCWRRLDQQNATT
jgi:hypothetical protein